MNLQQFISKYNGKVVLDGQCGNLVRQYWIEVSHTSPPSYTNSKDYWSNPVPGYQKITSSPQPGDTAIYDGHGAFPEGHSAIYAGSSQVFEQNADPDGSPAHLYTRANTYLLGYLREEITMGVTIQGSPAAVSTSSTRIDVFARGSDNNLYQRYWSNGWQPWVEIGTGIFSDPAVSSWGVDRFDVFATGQAGDLVHWYWPAAGGGWSASESLGAPS